MPAHRKVKADNWLMAAESGSLYTCAKSRPADLSSRFGLLSELCVVA